MATKLVSSAVLAQGANKSNDEKVKASFEQLKALAVAASFLTLRFYNTKSGIRMAIVNVPTTGARAYKEIKLPLNQELFDALLSICCGQEPSEIGSYDVTGWKAGEEEDFGFEVFKLMYENGFRICFGNDVVKEDVVHVPARITMSGKFAIEFYLTLNEEVEDYLKTNNLR